MADQWLDDLLKTYRSDATPEGYEDFYKQLLAKAQAKSPETRSAYQDKWNTTEQEYKKLYSQTDREMLKRGMQRSTYASQVLAGVNQEALDAKAKMIDEQLAALLKAETEAREASYAAAAAQNQKQSAASAAAGTPVDAATAAAASGQGSLASSLSANIDAALKGQTGVPGVSGSTTAPMWLTDILKKNVRTSK